MIPWAIKRRTDCDDQGDCAQYCGRVIDRAVQVHGALGVSQDTPLAYAWSLIRTLRLADGPDEVHMEQLRNLSWGNTNEISGQAHRGSGSAQFDEDALFIGCKRPFRTSRVNYRSSIESGQSNPTLVSGETMKVVLHKKPPGAPSKSAYGWKYRVMGIGFDRCAVQLCMASRQEPDWYAILRNEYLRGVLRCDATQQEPAARRAHFKELIR